MNLSLNKLSISLMLFLCVQTSMLFAQNATTYKIGQSIENFSLFDMNSTRYATRNIKTKKMIVLVFISNECSFPESIITSINKIHDQNSTEVEIWAVNSFNPNINPNESEEKMNDYAKLKGLKVPYLVDLGKTVADRFSVKQVPSAVILMKDAENFSFVYNGAVIETRNGSTYNILEQNISNLLSGKKANSSVSKNRTCQIQ